LFQFDNLRARRRLSVAVAPSVVVFQQTPDEGLIAAPVRFHMYTNYGAFIERAEVRIFEAGLSTQSTPLAVVAIDPNGSAEWQPGAKQLSAAGRELQYLVRAYGRDGKFDDTRPLSLWMVHDGSHAAATTVAAPETAGETAAAADPPGGGSTAAQEAAEPGSQGAAVKHAELKEPELLAAYGDRAPALGAEHPGERGHGHRTRWGHSAQTHGVGGGPRGAGRCQGQLRRPGRAAFRRAYGRSGGAR